ncbi:MAG: hypothetical protein ACXIUQ_09310 [Cecembia sp.]
MVKFFISLSFIIILFSKTDDPGNGIYYARVSEEEVYFKVTVEKGLAILEFFLDKKTKGEMNGQVKSGQIFFSDFSIKNEVYDLVFKNGEGHLISKNQDKPKFIKVEPVTKRIDLSLVDISKLIRNNLAPDLVGDWVMIYNLSPDGVVIDDEIKGKNYKVRYSENGSYILDPNAIRDNMPRELVKNFSFSDIPTATWRTEGNNLVINITGITEASESKSVFLIKSDTLLTTSVQGYTTVHVRRK